MRSSDKAACSTGIVDVPGLPLSIADLMAEMGRGFVSHFRLRSEALGRSLNARHILSGHDLPEEFRLSPLSGWSCSDRDVMLKISQSLMPGSADLPVDRWTRILAVIAPDIFNALQIFSPHMVLFRSDDSFSFALESHPSIVFLAVPESPNIGFFLEEYSHQATHNLLTRVIPDPAILFSQPWERTLPNKDEGDTRNAFVAFHGVVTLGFILLVLDAAQHHSALTHMDRFLIRGRKAFALCKFNQSALRLVQSGCLSGRGLNIVRQLLNPLATMNKEFSVAEANPDLAGQDYVFSDEIFLERNRPAGPVLDLME